MVRTHRSVRAEHLIAVRYESSSRYTHLQRMEEKGNDGIGGRKRSPKTLSNDQLRGIGRRAVEWNDTVYSIQYTADGTQLH